MNLPLLLAQSAPLPGLAKPTIVGTAIAYLVVCAAIAIWATRRTHTASDFFVAGKGIGLWALSIAAMAATLSGFAFIGGPGLIYTLGIGALFIVLPASITGSLSAWTLGTKMRLLAEVRGAMTIPDAIGARYRSPMAQGLSAIAILVATVGYLATNLLALGLIVDAIFATGLGRGIVIGTIVVMAYSAAGGILAGIYTDLFQGAVMAVASTLVFVAAMQSGGGLAEISRTILTHQPELFSPWGVLTPLAALSFFFVFGLGTLGQPHVLHKFYMLRDPRRLRWYPLIMTGALVLALLLYFGVGVAMKAAVLRGDLAALTLADEATPTFLLRSTSPWLAGLVFSGVAAAIMSTVNSFMSVGAAAVTHDIPRALGRQPANPLLLGRIATVVLAVLAAGLAMGSGLLVALLGVFGWGLFASTLVPALAIGMNWEGATRKGAIASMATGLVLTLVFETLAWSKAYTFPVGVTVSGLSLVIALLVFLGVSWWTRSNAMTDLDADIQVIMRY